MDKSLNLVSLTGHNFFSGTITLFFRKMYISYWLHKFFFERSTEKLFWNNVLLVLIHPSVILSCYQAWVSQQVGDNRCLKINTNMYVIALPFMKKREEEITRKQGNRNFYQVKSISYLGTSISINRSLPKVPVEGFLWSIYKRGDLPYKPCKFRISYWGTQTGCTTRCDLLQFYNLQLVTNFDFVFHLLMNWIVS